jgi:hypothetical protein
MPSAFYMSAFSVPALSLRRDLPRALRPAGGHSSERHRLSDLLGRLERQQEAFSRLAGSEELPALIATIKIDQLEIALREA